MKRILPLTSIVVGSFILALLQYKLTYVPGRVVFVPLCAVNLIVYLIVLSLKKK